MNTALSPTTIHFALPNGQHTVVLCDPSRLASAVRATDDFRFVTCFRCIACREQDKAEFRDEVQRRMNSPGAKGPS